MVVFACLTWYWLGMKPRNRPNPFISSQAFTTTANSHRTLTRRRDTTRAHRGARGRGNSQEVRRAFTAACTRFWHPSEAGIKIRPLEQIMAASPDAALARANRNASSAEELYEEGRWKQAIDKFEAAADDYISATLLTTDTAVVQSLRMLAQSHSQRAHELRLRAKLHGMHEGSDAAGGASKARVTPTTPPPGPTGTTGNEVQVSGAFARLCSQLISTHEELRFGAEELTRILLPLLPTATDRNASPSTQLAGGSAVLGAKPQQLIDSFYVVPPHRAGAPLGSPAVPRRALGEPLGPGAGLQHSSVLGAVGGGLDASGIGGSGGSGGHPLDPQQQLAMLSFGDTPSAAGGSASGSGGGGSSGLGGTSGPSLAQLSVENSRLSAENAALRQQARELNTAFTKIQRRAADQQRLARRALTALREVHSAPRTDLPDAAAKEVADLRKQLEQAHAAKRQQAELVKKWEQRWAQLKASARRKQQQQQQAQGQVAGGSRLRPETK